MGCTSRSIKTDVQETFVPILYCPAPPTITRPDLPIHQMSPNQIASSGELVKHYTATIIVLQGYAQELEQTLEQYNITNRAYDQLRDQLINRTKPTTE